MNPNWQKAKEIFSAGVEIEPANRDKFLDEACGGDADLRGYVESLLESDDHANSFLREPAIGGVADVLARSTMFEKGRRFGHYEIVELIGAGGMGEVYLAVDTRLNRQVALKFLSASVSGDESRFRRFEREALAVSALNHPNILTIYELRADDQIPFIATEFVNGETLAKRLKHRELGLKEILDVFEQTAFALAAAHKAGIIHRDIKPENIMLRDDGIVKILDFGLAKLIRPEVLIEDAASEPQATTDVNAPSIATTNSSGVMGTVAYMSPEQARGQANIDTRTDIWSLGVVVYEMLACSSPFKGESPGDVIDQIIRSKPTALSTSVDGIPPDLAGLVERSLSKDPVGRYQSANLLLDEIRRVKSDLDFRSKIEEVPQTLHRLKEPKVPKPGQTSALRPTENLRILNDTNGPDPYTTDKRKVSSPIGRFFGARVNGIAALLALIALSVVGAVYLRSAMTTKPDVFTVDTTADDPSLTACTSAPNDCSLGGAIENAEIDDRSNTVLFDDTAFASHQTINLKSGFDVPGKLTVNGPASGVTLLLELDPTTPHAQKGRRLFALFEAGTELEISNLRLMGGSTFQGGGIYNANGIVTVKNSVIAGNSSTETGGGITNRVGKITVIDSIIANNSSLSGGGIANVDGTFTLINTIVSGNSAPLGGGVRNERGTLTMINSTIVDNSASTAGGLFNFNGTSNLYNSIVANSGSGGDCLRYNDTINAEHSLIEDGLTCVNGINKKNLAGDPGIGPVSDNGGLDFSYRFLPGSIAVDSGLISLAVDATGQPLATERRGSGFPRVTGVVIDLGAFEYQSPTKQDQCGNDGWRHYANPTFPKSRPMH